MTAGLIELTPFEDTNRRLLGNVDVPFFLPGTTTLAKLWSNPEKTAPASNPVRTDAAGNLPAVYADPGRYEFEFRGVRRVTQASVVTATAEAHTHVDLAPVTHTHPAHDHDGNYAPLTHTHVLPAHDHAHNHDTAYSSVTHTHPLPAHDHVHNHDLAYSSVTHTHALPAHDHAHPDLAAHDTLGLATQAELDGHTGATTAAHGGIVASTDARLTDQRVPIDGSVTNAKVAATAAIAESKLALASDAVATTPSRRSLGTGAQQATAGNDPRLSDARTPTAHKATHATGGTDALAPADIGAAAASHGNHPSADVAGGYAALDSGLLVPRARLGGGTPDTTTFLRGDGAWAVPPSSSGGGATLQALTLGGDVVLTATSVLTPLEIFSFAVDPNKTYAFDIILVVVALSGTAPTMRFGFTGPAGVSSFQAVGRQGSTTSTDHPPFWTALGDDPTLRAVSNGTSHIFRGIIVNGANAGRVGFRCAAVGGTTPSITLSKASNGSATG